MYTDLHCHLLPGIDDGSKAMDQSLAMARLAVADGIHRTVVTPHHLNGVYDNPAEFIHRQLDQLSAALKEDGIELELLPGAELHLVPELPQQLEDGRALTIGNRGRAALVELPVHHIPVSAEEILDHLLAMGLTPVIAHPERNSHLRKQPDILAEWVAMGCLSQVTAQSCTGLFGRDVQHAAHDLISRGLVHVIASDAHRDRRRVPQLSAGQAQLAEWFGETLAERLAVDWPNALADGATPDVRELDDLLEEPERPWWKRWLGR